MRVMAGEDTEELLSARDDKSENALHSGSGAGPSQLHPSNVASTSTQDDKGKAVNVGRLDAKVPVAPTTPVKSTAKRKAGPASVTAPGPAPPAADGKPPAERSKVA